MKQFKMVIFNVTPINTDVTDLQSFEEKVIKAKELGATHVLVTEITKNRWYWEEDLSDPYPNWGMLNSSLFKIIVPEALKKWIPEEYASKNLLLIKKRSEILRKHGLRAAAHFCEPFYLPEGVYRENPDWRGPRCEHPRRAKRAYYSPCVDHPEILAMYKKAFKELCQLCDIDYLYLHTNDCGAGICWSDGLYTGPNGPEHCRHNSQTGRLLNFLKVFKEAAGEAGRDLAIEINSNIGVKETDDIMENIWPFLDDDMAVNFKTNKGTPLSTNVDVNYEFTVAPIRNIPMAFELAELLEKGYQNDSPILKITLLDDDFDLQYKIISAFRQNPTNGIAARVNLLMRAARQICDDAADNLVNAWWKIYLGLKHLYSTLMEGFTWFSVNQRLINRPFVLFPDELSPEEKDYYRRYQFQATTEEAANDLLDNQGSGFVKGYHAVFLASMALDKAMKSFKEAQAEYDAITKKRENLASSFSLAKDRVELLIAFCKNYQNAMQFQQVIDETDFTEEPVITSLWPQDADKRLTKVELVTRSEIDNTRKIINLIKGREREMLVLAPSPEEEDIFWLTPNIVETLEKKIAIMLDRQLDVKRVYVTANK